MHACERSIILRVDEPCDRTMLLVQLFKPCSRVFRTIFEQAVDVHFLSCGNDLGHDPFDDIDVLVLVVTPDLEQVKAREDMREQGLTGRIPVLEIQEVRTDSPSLACMIRGQACRYVGDIRVQYWFTPVDENLSPPISREHTHDLVHVSIIEPGGVVVEDAEATLVHANAVDLELDRLQPVHDLHLTFSGVLLLYLRDARQIGDRHRGRSELGEKRIVPFPC